MIRLILAVCLMFLLNTSVTAQNWLTYPINNIFIDTTFALTVDQVSSREFLKRTVYRDSIDLLSLGNVWMKLKMGKSSIYQSENIVLEGLNFSEVYECVKKKNGVHRFKRILLRNASEFRKVYILTASCLKDKEFYFKVAILPEKERRTSVLVRHSSLANDILGFGFVVSCIFFFLFTFIQYLYTKERVFISYFFYLLSLITFILYVDFQNSDIPYFLYPFRDVSVLPVFAYLFLLITIGAYFIFLYSYLDLAVKSPKAANSIKIIFGILGLSFMCMILTFTIERKANLVFTYTSWAIAPFVLYMFYYISKLWNKKKWGINLVLIGSGVLYFPFVINFVLGLFGVSNNGNDLIELNNSNDSLLIQFLRDDFSSYKKLFITKSAVLIEILLFSAALGFKSKKKAYQKTVAETQLLENQLIAQKKESDLQLKIANAEQKALKAQMNPHFMFNCLNSIKNLIQQQENDTAEEYLIKFSQLIRGVVDYSQEASIPLDKELKFCKLYMNMEALRFGDNFNFEIEILDSIDTSFYNIPPFIFQPLLENSLWHGLVRKKGKKSIRILIYNRDNIVCCMVDDNGIGLKEAAEHNANKAVTKKSVGIKNTKERLELFNDLFGMKIDLKIMDKTDSNGESKGVTALITIPQ